jgi:2-(1,2-epoxy-1,2-dihydrophenyl)acetyl-CoA isomerase
VSDPVLVAVDAGVATLTLNRPASLNALDAVSVTLLREALDRAASDPAIRAVVLTGAGRGFCAGQDLAELQPGTRDVEALLRESLNPLVRSVAELPKPVVAAVNGVAAGAGAGLAFAADLRLAADSASFVTAFAGIGLSVDAGMSWTLPRLAGSARASALLLLGERVDAESALEMGLVNAVVPAASLLGAALELASRLAAGPTAAYAGIKASLAAAASAPLAEALETEARVQGRVARTADHAEGVRAFRARERPRFSGA